MDQKKIKNILSAIIKALDLKVTSITISEELEKYADPVPLNKISYLLNGWNVITRIQRLNLAQLYTVSLPAVITLTEQKLAVLLDVDNGLATLVDENNEKRTLPLADFGKIYANTVLIAEKGKKTGEADYRGKRRKEVVEKLRKPAIIFGLIILAGVYISQQQYVFNGNAIFFFLLFLFKSAGLVTTVILLLQNINENDPLIQRFCGSDSDKNCNAILTSDAAKLTPELSWSEIGFFYFSGSFLALAFSNGRSEFIQLLALINICSLPYTFYSIYYQWRVAQQWCLFCCIIQGILWCEFFSFLPYWHHWHLPGPLPVTTLTASFIMPIVLWISLKPLLSLRTQMPVLVSQLNKYKFNKQIFTKLLEENPAHELLPFEETINIGTPDAAKVLTIVSNPYCGHCARVHKILDSWLSKRRDIRFQLVFVTHADARRRAVAANALSIYLRKGQKPAKRAVNAWYKQSRKSYQYWASRYPIQPAPEVEELVNKQNNWCNRLMIRATPTLYINGREVPKMYGPEDLKYLI